MYKALAALTTVVQLMGDMDWSLVDSVAFNGGYRYIMYT